MTNRIFLIAVTAAATLFASSCKSPGGKVFGDNKSSGYGDGQVHGVSPDAKWSPMRPFGMVYVRPGTFHMGPSDEDMNFSYTARNKSVSISGFWMDQTEISNNQYRVFTNWVRDSIAATELKYFKQTAKNNASNSDANLPIDWA
jgi:formylglycine-generating enzyme required for sulfatase activity